jgi:hypothetical protein
MLEVEITGGCKKTKPLLADDEIFDIVLEKLRTTSPRINTPHLNTKGTKDELTAQRGLQIFCKPRSQRSD